MLPGLLAIRLDGIAAVRRAEGALRCDAGSDSCLARATHPAGLFASFALPSRHPVPNHVMSPDIALSVTPAYRDRFLSPGTRASPCSGKLTASHSRCGFVIPRLREGKLYGLPVRLRLLPTPPHGDAVTFGFIGRDLLWVGLPPPDKATSRTHRSIAAR